MSEATQLDEIVVTERGQGENVRSKIVGLKELTVKQMKLLPSLMGQVDILKSLTILAGVNTNPDGIGGLNIRGSNPDQNLIVQNDKMCIRDSAYADLDNDGDLDYITNNINDVAHLYENKTNTQNKKYLKIKIKGNKPNLDAIGTKINYSGQNIKGTYEHSPSRGYLSTVDVYKRQMTDCLISILQAI